MIKAWEQVFLQVLNMSITAGYCVLVVMLLRVFLRRAPKIYSYVLWAVVWFRLVCPVSIESVLSFVRVPAQVIPMDIGVREVPEISSGSARVDAVINSGIRLVLPDAAVGDSVNPMQVVLAVAGVIWILVAVFLIAYNGYVLLRLKRQLAEARQVEANIYEAENLQTPFVLGFFVPRIYLPSDLCGAEREYVLLHEKTHIKRRDYLVKQLAFAVTCLYWFHPLIWLAFFRMCRDMEMSCDESVIRKLGGAVKKDYSASLLALASGRQIVGGSPLAFGESSIRQRIKNILRYRRPTFLASLFFVTVLALVLAGLTFSPKTAEEDSLTDTETVDAGSFADAVAYQGYLDESAAWDNAWSDCDFDGDGAWDRVYRGVTEDAVSYRIDFGAGGTLEIGEFEDPFIGLKLASADVTGDGRNEILFVGSHGASTDPFAMSEIALFEKVDDRYVRALLPCPESVAQSGNTGGYEVGFDIYAKREDGQTFHLMSEDIGLDAVITLEEEVDEFYLDGFRDGGTVLWGSLAYDADFIQHQGKECLMLYQNLGDKWVDESVGIVLEMRMSEDSRAPHKAAAVAAGVLLESGELESGDLETGRLESRLYLHVPDYMADSEYIDTKMLPEETAEALAQRALTELYELTGTRVEECFYYYDDMGGFSFAMTKEDMDAGRIFYSRTFGVEEHPAFVSIPSMFVSNARRVWYSPVYQYDLPADFADYEGSQRAEWFLKQSALYNGQEVAECVQPYSAMPETWQIIMEDGTAYEVSLDNEIDSVHDVTGPYPDRYISH